MEKQRGWMMTTAAAAKDETKDMPLPPAPFLSSVMQIEPQWIDYNGHLNMAYYNVMMDRAIDEMWLQARDRAGLHEGTPRLDLHRRMPCSLFARDSPRRSRSDFGLSVGHDEKRLHTFEELRHATEGWLSATSENMTLHMDMKARKVPRLPA